LQEADAATLRAGRHEIAPELAALLSMHYAFTGMNTPRDVVEHAKKWYLDFEEHIAPDDAGDTGVALLSKFPMDETARIDLPWAICPWRPRLGIYGKFIIGSTPLHVFNSHIDTHAATDAQLSQHEAILTRAESFAARGEPTLLVGDFNTLKRESAKDVRRFLEARGYTTPFATGTTTWRAGLIRLHTDWIFTRNLKSRATACCGFPACPTTSPCGLK
jgi:endonuclease/exonuclease/phosphatase family metal-dependent hydrolase